MARGLRACLLTGALIRAPFRLLLLVPSACLCRRALRRFLEANLVGFFLRTRLSLRLLKPSTERLVP